VAAADDGGDDRSDDEQRSEKYPERAQAGETSACEVLHIFYIVLFHKHRCFRFMSAGSDIKNEIMIPQFEDSIVNPWRV
jgi:hypothetical protein